MTDQPRPRWFQWQLSTMVAMTLTAGVILFANFYPRSADHVDVDNDFCVPNEDFRIHYSMLIYRNRQLQGIANRYGWPIVGAGHFEWDKGQVTIFNQAGIAADTVFALVILMFLTVMCEWLARRRKRVPGE